MANYPEHTGPGPERVPNRDVARGDQVRAGAVAGGSTGLAIGGLAAAVLCILGLLNMWPFWMLYLSVLCIGAAMVIHGLGIMTRQAHLASQVGATPEIAEATAGVSPEFLAGCAGIVLGILAIIDIYPLTLCIVALIVFGSALFFGGSPRVHAGQATAESTAHPAGYSLLSRSTAAHLMVGLGAMTLGVLALLDYRPLTLTLVGLLCVGSALLLTGSAVAVMMASRASRDRQRARI